MGDTKDALAYSLSNDFPSIKCRLSDETLIPENTVPLFIDFDYDMVLSKDRNSKSTTQILRKVENTIVHELTEGLFNCTVVTDEEERRQLADQRAATAVVDSKISVVGLDAKPNDVINDFYSCAPDLMTTYGDNGDCYAINGAMAIALTTDGVQKIEEIKLHVLSDIQSGMTYDEYLSADEDLIKLQFIGDRDDPDYGKDWPTATPSTTPSTTPSAAPSEKDVNFVAVIPGDGNMGTAVADTGGDGSHGGFGFLEVGAIIIGFLILLILLILLVRRRDRNRKEDEATADGDDFEDVSLEEVVIGGGAGGGAGLLGEEEDDDDVEGGSAGFGAGDGHINLAICGIIPAAGSRRTATQQQQQQQQGVDYYDTSNINNNSINNNERVRSPRYGDASFGAVHSVHDVHNCRSQTCEACGRAGISFVPVTPDRFYIK